MAVFTHSRTSSLRFHNNHSLDLHQRVHCLTQGFADGDVSTAFISEHENELLKFKQLSDEQVSMMRLMRLMYHIL
jgi:hypothetical protein